jgi:hypothetical protein
METRNLTKIAIGAFFLLINTFLLSQENNNDGENSCMAEGLDHGYPHVSFTQENNNDGENSCMAEGLDLGYPDVSFQDNGNDTGIPYMNNDCSNCYSDALVSQEECLSTYEDFTHRYPENWNQAMNDFSNQSYHHDYSNSYFYCHNPRARRDTDRFNSDAFLHRRYGGQNNFSSGISSYQGTSTGPGPNGGYPGTPRGFYKTRYYSNEY